MGISKETELKKMGLPSIRTIIENNDLFNDVINNSIDIEEKHSPEIIEIELQNSQEILERKKNALLQALDILKNVICYGELDEEIRKINNFVEDVEADLKTIDSDLEDLKVKYG